MSSDNERKARDQESPKTFVVRDRRRFDSEGQERDENSAEVLPSGPQSSRGDTSASKPQGAISGGVAREPAVGVSARTVEGYETGDSDINFSSFVISLATQALMQLGEMQPPPGINVPLDRESARHTIDILGMLQHKTQSNLTEDEAKLLEEVLHNLRLSYVRAAQTSAM